MPEGGAELAELVGEPEDFPLDESAILEFGAFGTSWTSSHVSAAAAVVTSAVPAQCGTACCMSVTTRPIAAIRLLRWVAR
jgi:hypothetical protein